MQRLGQPHRVQGGLPECHVPSLVSTIHLIHPGRQGRHHVGHVGEEAFD